jgi:hypothetical protein
MFRAYKRNDDVKQGAGGYVMIRGIWRSLLFVPEMEEHTGEKFVVSLLGWGETFGGFLCDYSKEEQELLFTTLTEKEKSTCQNS